MPKLHPKAQIKPTKTLLRKILKNYSLRLESFVIAQSGIENTTALVITNKGSYALRVYRKNKKKLTDIDQELNFMELLRTHGLPVPIVFPDSQDIRTTKIQITNSTWQCFLMQLMDGIHPKTYSSPLIKNMAVAHAKMHTLGMLFSKKYRKTPQPQILQGNSFIKKIPLTKIKRGGVLRFLERTKKFTITLDKKLPQGFNHLDYDHTNILTTNNTLSAILDFDDLAYSPIAVCLGYTLWDILYITRDVNKVKLYLQEYQKNRPLLTIELARLKDTILFRHYAIATLEILFWGENGKHVDTFLAFEKTLLNLKTLA